MVNQKEVGTAYGLSMLTFVGIAGVHRFYMGKTGTGLIWLFTLGLIGFGTLYDWFTMSKQIKMVNLLNAGPAPGYGGAPGIIVNVGQGAGQGHHGYVQGPPGGNLPAAPAQPPRQQ